MLNFIKSGISAFGALVYSVTEAVNMALDCVVLQFWGQRKRKKSGRLIDVCIIENSISITECYHTAKLVHRASK